jgi:serine/threonine protein kinase
LLLLLLLLLVLLLLLLVVVLLVINSFLFQICDFGLSREVSEKDQAYVASVAGIFPLRWTAPEAIQSRGFSTASDVWAFGIFCGEVFDDGELVCSLVYVGLSYF